MFRESCTVATSPTSIGGIALRCVWNVEADRNYDVTADYARQTSVQNRPEGATGLIACRTLAGKGRAYLTDNHVVDARDGILFIVPWDRLTRYHCVGDHWHFWWFEFDAIGPLTVPCNTTMIVPVESHESNILTRILSNLRVEDVTHRMLACSQFQTMLLEWVARRTDRPERANNEQCIQDVIARMYDQLDTPLSISQMARMAHLSEPHFRHLFRAVTGYSPKKFYDRLRLAWAEHMLRTERKNVSEVARALGFCSPFHFSRVFHRHFGFPPSHLYRPKGD